MSTNEQRFVNVAKQTAPETDKPWILIETIISKEGFMSQHHKAGPWATEEEAVQAMRNSK